MKYELASSSWDEKEIDAIKRVIDSGFYTFGKNVSEFEKEFAQFTDHKYSVMVNSGSSANLLAVAAMFYKKENPLKAGDEVIVPVVSWATTYYPLYQYGLKLKFVDVDLETLNLDLKQLEKAISEKTKMIFAVNLLGNPNDYDEIKRIIGNRNIYLLEDNCESLGGIYKGKQLGSIGLIGTYSTFFSHHMSTMEGGVVATDDEELNEIILCLRSHGWTRQLPKVNTLCTKSDDYFEEGWRFILPGYNLRPTEMNGAVGLEQLKKLPEFIKWRRINAAHFQDIFSNDERFIIQKEIGQSSWFGFSLIFTDDKINRKKVIDKCTEANIDTRPIVAGNFARKEVVKYFNHEIFGELKVADFIENRGFFVGNHQFDIRDKIDYLKKTLDCVNFNR